MTAGLMKLFSADIKVGFLAHANRFAAAAADGQVLAPAKDMAEMHRIVFNDRLDAALCALFVLVVASLAFFSVRSCIEAYRSRGWTARELPGDLVPAE
jgi:carbon starvation protein